MSRTPRRLFRRTCSISFLVTGLELRDEVRVMTERLFDVPGVAPVRFPGSRLVLDPERFESDDEEIMATRGMGVIYTRTSQQTRLRRSLSPRERARVVARWYRPSRRVDVGGRRSDRPAGRLPRH